MSDLPHLAELEKLAERILERFMAYCRVPSITGSRGENLVPPFFRSCLENLPYFVDHPEHLGTWQVENDPLGRQVCWAMIRGGCAKTVVLLHHYDVVVTDNYGSCSDLALEPERLEQALKADSELLDDEARRELFSGDWIFGRGAADMKGGGAIQLALFDHYANLSKQELQQLPTLILLAVPDEENLSAGMRSAVRLLADLKGRHQLDFKLLINSEPHQRLDPARGLLSQGSIGKLNLFVYVRGVMAHAGKVLEGINPTGLLARIVAETDLNEVFVDRSGHEVSIPPTWIFMRDLKKQYDISFPEACYGMFNVLSFHSSPAEVVGKMAEICRKILDDYLKNIRLKRARVKEITGQNWPAVSWTPRVVTYKELKAGTRTPAAPLPIEEELAVRSQRFCPEDPLIVVGFCPPCYPGVTNPDQRHLHELVAGFSRQHFGQDYDNQAYYTGISDMSYAMSAGDPEVMNSSMDDMAGAEGYQIPFEQIQEISMDCVNIGPWGKDFHKPSERVLKEDLLHRTPLLLDHVIRNFLLVKE